MIRAALRLLWPTIDPTPSAQQRAAELSAAYAVATFLDAGGGSLPLSLRDDHRRDGLSGVRTWRMLDVLRAGFEDRPDAAATGLAQVRRSLAAEIGSADRRDVAHLRMLDAFAAGVEALRLADRHGGSLDEDARGRIAAQARDAAGALPDEPYLRYLHARTLDRLGRPDEAATVLDRSAGGAWLQGWQADFTQWRDHFRSAAGRLPRGTPPERLRAMSAQRDWLDLAGADLPGLLADEASAVARPGVVGPRFVLHVRDAEDGEAQAKRLIGSAADDLSLATIGALRSAIRRRFQVVLPGVEVRGVPLPPGDAIAFVDDAAFAAARQPADAAPTDEVTTWWPGAAAASPALQALLVAALRTLPRLPAETPPASRDAAEARALMHADRLSTEGLAADWADGSAGGPALPVAARRLDPAVVPTLWGNGGGHWPMLLDGATEDALHEGLVPSLGLAVPDALFHRIGLALRRRAAAYPRPFALVVRDPSIRPLLRLLLQDDFPDLPVLALAEVDFRHGFALVALDASALPAAAAP